ncbi:hypothetical protein R1sor_011093 [Riccia sorocarpa]|uniref:Methyltransferase n=1 Tax=Riccia sorocarpa TaxID=122646 RepID=A0ABD3I3M8_9MARC
MITESSYRKVLLVALFTANLVVIWTLMIDFRPVLRGHHLHWRVHEAKQGYTHPALSREEEVVETVYSTDWRRYPLEWWENENLRSKDPNWSGRQRMHKELKYGNLWYDESLEQYFIHKLNEHQFPSNCSRNHWIAYQPMHSGLLSCVHVFTPLLMAEMIKGEGYTVIPVGYFNETVETNPTYFGCGELKEWHLGCFFNLTSCRIEDDSTRYSAVVEKSTSQDPLGASWDDFIYGDKSPGGVTI